MPELSELFGALADDANRAALSSPTALRRRADRRARTRVMLACAVTVVVVGIAGTAWGVLHDRGNDTIVGVEPSQSASNASAAPSASPSVTPGRTTSSAKPPTSVPATALLKLPAANRSDIADVDTTSSLPSGPQVVDRRGWRTSFHHVGDPGRTSAETIDQSITIYKAGQAEATMNHRRTAVAAKPSEPVAHGQVRHVLVPLQGLGDEAFRIESTRPRFNPALEVVDGEVTTFDTYIRIGAVVTIVSFYGSEGGSTPRTADVQVVTSAAVEPLRKWLSPG